jgi:hypothetical protein
MAHVIVACSYYNQPGRRKFMEQVYDLERIDYRAYAQPPFKMDATGFVEADCLQLIEEHGEYKGDDIVMDGGYIAVYSECFDGWFAVKKNNVYTEVFEEERLMSGWGSAYPLGGSVDMRPPEFRADPADVSGLDPLSDAGQGGWLYLVRHAWNQGGE